MADGGDIKPAQQTISVTLKDQDGSILTFKVKRGTKVEKILKAFADKKGGAVGSYRLLFEGSKLEPDVTLETAGVDDGDQLDVQQEQTGGC